jgi:protein AATF/BFR2
VDIEDNRAHDSGDEGSDSQDSEDERAGTEHYVEVGKSKLRKPDEVPLGPKYVGARVSRDDLENDDDDSASEGGDDEEEGNFADPDLTLEVDEDDGEIDSDGAFGEDEEDSFKAKGFTFRGSGKNLTVADTKPNGVKKSGKNGRMSATDFYSDSEDHDSDAGVEIGANGIEEDGDEEDEDDEDEDIEEDEDEEVDGEEEDGDEDDEEDDDEDEDEDEDDDMDDKVKAERAELRRIMNEEQKTVVATISQAAKADAEKGKAVKQQRKAFDSLLNVRIRLQKALIATNSLHVAEEQENDTPLPYQAAEEAAIKLLNTLGEMRQQLYQAASSGSALGKRKRIEAVMPSSAIWQGLQDSEAFITKSRQATLQKWSSRVRETTAQPVQRKIGQAVAQSTIIDVLQDHLLNSDRLVKRTKMPRSCAPAQVKQKVAEDPAIYDDADFYQLLLKELVEQRMVDSSNTPLGEGGQPLAQWTAVKEAKTRKHVDTKASKGRKLRYTVHEKLQNFMAAEDRTSWEEDAVERFFGTLLGQKMTLGEEDEVMADGEEEKPLEEEALMLFRS